MAWRGRWLYNLALVRGQPRLVGSVCMSWSVGTGIMIQPCLFVIVGV